MSSATQETRQGDRRAFITDAAHSIPYESRSQAQTYIDATSGCYNRHYLLEILEPQIAVSQQYSFPLSLVLAELAHFRKVRYTFGDRVADGTIREVAGLLRGAIRATDLLVAFSEDTFAILFLHATQFGAARACERLRSAIGRHVFPGGKSDLIVTVNFGIAEQSAEFDPHGRALIRAAEAALRRAAAEGEGAIVRAIDLGVDPLP